MRGPVFNARRHCVLSLLVHTCLMIFPAAGHVQDSYLETLRLEEEKLNGAAADGVDEAKSRAPAGANDPVAQFEQELEAGYRGTYLFYKKLPAKSQEEVFVEHQQGASIEEVRETIMNRYRHSR